jgi:hypothetical protein
MPPFHRLFLSRTNKAVDVVGERIDAKTCDGFETGED